MFVSDQVLRVERDGTRARVVMQRPGVRNAFNAELIAALRTAFDELGRDPGVRTIVLAGDGTTFSGGADIAWMRAALDLDAAANQRDAAAMAAMFRAIDGCPKPVVAQIHGAAIGGGCGLVAAADVAIAADDAVFAFSEVTLGIIPAVIAPFVVGKIGRSHARALFVTGERFDAAHARAIGLVHDVVPAGDLDARVAGTIAALECGGTEAIAAAKALVAHVDPDAPDVDAFTARAIAERRVSAEGQEGLRAFLERRPPAWRA